VARGYAACFNSEYGFTCDIIARVFQAPVVNVEALILSINLVDVALLDEYLEGLRGVMLQFSDRDELWYLCYDTISEADVERSMTVVDWYLFLAQARMSDVEVIVRARM
jgi:hypothetical protein